MASRRALRAVKDEPDEQPQGDSSLTRETIAGWKQGQRRCRARKRHNWRPLTVWEHRSYFDVVEQCSECRNRRSADYNKQGHKLTDWKPDYRDGYLLPKGAMRLDDELRDELSLTDILSRRIVEVVDDEDDDVDDDAS